MPSNLVNGEPSKSQPAAPTSTVLTETLRQVRAMSPEESLGVKETSGLMKPFIQAFVVTLILFTALTIGPYFYEKAFPTAPKAQKEKPAEAAAVAPKPPEGDNTAKKSDGPPAKVAGKKDINDTLGESGVKKGTPANPFDTKEVDPLKGLIK